MLGGRCMTVLLISATFVFLGVLTVVVGRLKRRIEVLEVRCESLERWSKW
jgi:hypothetical protein